MLSVRAIKADIALLLVGTRLNSVSFSESISLDTFSRPVPRVFAILVSSASLIAPLAGIGRRGWPPILPGEPMRACNFDKRAAADW